MTLRIAHISDLHIGPLIGFSPRHWNLKRALGYMNWQNKRRHIHRPEIADRLLVDLAEQEPDHWAITGDLVNIGLPAEYGRAAEWLAAVGPPDKVSLVPGNHDIYTRLWTDKGVDRWQAYMTSDDWGRSIGTEPGDFPYLRRIGDVAIIGLNTAVPTPPGIATGRLGWRQARELARILTALGEADLFRLVLLHHPPLPGMADVRHRLRDAHELEAVLADAGAELVLYGHTHRNALTWFEEGARPLPIVGVASASSTCQWQGNGLARYNLYDIARRTGSWTITLTARGLEAAEGPIVEVDHQVIEI